MQVVHKKTSQPAELPPKANTFAIYFHLEATPGGIKRGQTDLIFDPQQFPSLLSNDTPTEQGYQVLIETLGDILVQLADTAGKSTNLNADTLKRKAATKISGARRLKLIGLN